MTIYDQGDIVLVPFPFTDSSTLKKRPALVISVRWFNSIKGDHILVGITASFQPDNLDADMIHIRGRELTDTSLYDESVIKAGSIFTVNTKLIIHKIGRLNHSLTKKVLEKISQITTR